MARGRRPAASDVLDEQHQRSCRARLSKATQVPDLTYWIHYAMLV